MKKYCITLLLSFCAIASAMEKGKKELSEKHSDSINEICKPTKYKHCILRAQSYLSNRSPEYSYTQTDEFVEAVLGALSVKFKTDETDIAHCLNHRLIDEWRKTHNNK